MENDFEKALENLLKYSQNGESSDSDFGELFGDLISASMKICGETDYGSLADEKAASVERKFGVKMEQCEANDEPYKKLRNALRLEMKSEAISRGADFEICCTEENRKAFLNGIRGELESFVPESGRQFVDSIGDSLYSDFADFFVGRTLDTIADAKIYAMREFRPLQLNAMGKELRTYANIVKRQNLQAQKSQTVTDRFKTMFVFPAFLFKKLYAVDMVKLFENSERQIADAERLFGIFEETFPHFLPGDEYPLLEKFQNVLNFGKCLTIRPRRKTATEKPLVN